MLTIAAFPKIAIKENFVNEYRQIRTYTDDITIIGHNGNFKYIKSDNIV